MPAGYEDRHVDWEPGPARADPESCSPPFSGGFLWAYVYLTPGSAQAGMQRAMARQAEAERERRAKVIAAEGEFQASERLKDAAVVLAENPMSLQLRFLQTMLEISSERSSTIILPLPIELFRPLLGDDSSR
jgi:hypothetical protein